MDHPEIREIDPPKGQSLQTSAEPYLVALSEQYAQRGLCRSAQLEADEQIRREALTAAEAPDAYRLSTLSEAAITGCYRRGKDTMSSADLLLYFDETRQNRIQNADFTGNTGIDECTEQTLKTETAPTLYEPSQTLPARIKGAITSLPSFLKDGATTWFDGAKPDTSKDHKHFPLSAFAAIAAVAASLMLIVASSVLLTRAESSISRLEGEVSSLSAQVLELRSNFEADVDLLDVRRIAMEEYGMVEEDYVKMDYISLTAEDTVEAFEEERGGTVGLSSILSAIGIKK